MTADPYDLAHEAALVGTSRTRAGDLEQASAQLLGPPTEVSPETRLLEVAAAVTRVRRATTRPSAAQDRSAPDPAPARAREIGPASSAALTTILLVEQVEVRVEALGWIAGHGLTLDADATVTALEQATSQPALRADVAEAAGPRGSWLAAQNAPWSWLRPSLPIEEAEQRWDHATLAERTALLREVRAHDPARGLALLARTWDSERADALAALLPALEPGLSAADEPSLESRLDDKRVQVRRAAAALLAQLDASRLVQRAVDRAEQRLRITGRLRKSLEADPPAKPDEQMVRDAVPTDRLPDAGESASLLGHDLARVPPHRLRELLGVDAERLVGLARASDWWASLRYALTLSGQRWGDADTLRALEPHVPLSTLVEGVRDDGVLADLAQAQLRRSGGRLSATDRARDVLLTMPGPWGSATTRVLWPALLLALDTAGRDAPAYWLQEVARTAGRRLLVAQAPLPLDLDRYTSDAARRAAETVLTTYTHRQLLHAALAHDARTVSKEIP